MYAIALLEGNGKATKLGPVHGLYGEIAGALNPLAKIFKKNGASIGLTNMKEPTFDLVAQAYPEQFAGKEWLDIANNPDLAL